MTVQKMVGMLQKRFDNGLSQDKVIELCFAVIQQHPSIIERNRAAVILSGVIKPGLGIRTREFLRKNPLLPGSIEYLLGSAIMRMEGH
ncbi:MAG: hypothetical protein V1686_01930 [Patescibacteria group bacterium]